MKVLIGGGGWGGEGVRDGAREGHSQENNTATACPADNDVRSLSSTYNVCKI